MGICIAGALIHIGIYFQNDIAQCDAIITRYAFSKILKIDTQ